MVGKSAPARCPVSDFDWKGAIGRINGGLNGLADRAAYLVKAKQAFGISPVTVTA